MLEILKPDLTAMLGLVFGWLVIPWLLAVVNR